MYAVHKVYAAKFRIRLSGVQQDRDFQLVGRRNFDFIQMLQKLTAKVALGQ